MSQIIFINRYFYPDESATSLMLSDLIFGLAQKGIPVAVVTSRQRYEDPRAQLPRRETLDGVSVYRIPSTSWGRARLAGRLMDYVSFYVSLTLFLLIHGRKFRLAVAKTDPPMVSVLTWMMGFVTGLPYVTWNQDVFPEIAFQKPRRGWVFRALRLLRDTSWRGARLNVVLDEDMEAIMRDRGVEKSRISVSPNWADGKAVKPDSGAGEGLRTEWGLRGRFILGYSGNLGRVHELETFRLAWDSADRPPEWRALFVGGGALYEKLRNYYQNPEEKGIVLKPYQPRESLNENLAVPDVHWFCLNPGFRGLVVPSKFYGILAAGKPCIFVGDTQSAIARMIVDNRVGKVVSPGDAEGFLKKVNEFANNPNGRRETGQRARELFQSKFDYADALKRWIRVLMACSKH